MNDVVVPEIEIVDALAKGVDVPCFGVVPSQKPDVFLTFQRTGGSAKIGLEEVVGEIVCWASEKYGAAVLASKVRDYLLCQMREDVLRVSAVSVDSIAQAYDADTRRPAYSIDVTIFYRL